MVRSFLSDPIRRKCMLTNPISISLKWPILSFLLYSKTACQPLIHTRNNNTKQNCISKLQFSQNKKQGKQRHERSNVQRLNVSISNMFIYMYILGEFPGGSKGPIFGHIRNAFKQNTVVFKFLWVCVVFSGGREGTRPEKMKIQELQTPRDLGEGYVCQFWV